MRPVHSMIHVRDLDSAVAFYEAALGFVEVDRHSYPGATLVYLRGPESAFEIELVSPDDWAFSDKPEAGRTHLGLTVDDLDAEHARLISLGVSVDPVTDHIANGVHQTRYFYFSDPEGNQIEFLESKGRYAGREERAC